MRRIECCPFCRMFHQSEYDDELEEMILRCRDRVPESQWGRVEDYPWEVLERTPPITEVIPNRPVDLSGGG